MIIFLMKRWCIKRILIYLLSIQIRWQGIWQRDGLLLLWWARQQKPSEFGFWLQGNGTKSKSRLWQSGVTTLWSFDKVLVRWARQQKPSEFGFWPQRNGTKSKSRLWQSGVTTLWSFDKVLVRQKVLRSADQPVAQRRSVGEWLSKCLSLQLCVR